MNKLRFLKARLTEAEYRHLVERADAAGMTLSEYVRVVLARDREHVDVQSLLAEIRAQLALATGVSSGAGVTTPTPLHASPDPLLVEAIWLLRELAAERNAQALPRLASKLDAAFGRERSRV